MRHVRALLIGRFQRQRPAHHRLAARTGEQVHRRHHRLDTAEKMNPEQLFSVFKRARELADLMEEDRFGRGFGVRARVAYRNAARIKGRSGGDPQRGNAYSLAARALQTSMEQHQWNGHQGFRRDWNARRRTVTGSAKAKANDDG